MTLRLTEEEYAALMKRRDKVPASAPMAMQTEDRPKRSKYGNRKVEINGMKFDSQHEADVYLTLADRVKRGELRCVVRQVPFDLPGGIKYVADFITIGHDMKIEAVIDAKSRITKMNRTYINKRKQMRACWGIDITEL